MVRYKDVDKLITHLKDEIEGVKIPMGGRAQGKTLAYGTALGLKMAISFAETLPEEDVVPREEAEWVFIPSYYPYEVDKYMCSRCKTQIRADEKYKIKFCFSCGAKMEGGAGE